MNCMKYDCPALENAELFDAAYLDDYVDNLKEAAENARGLHTSCTPDGFVEALEGVLEDVGTGAEIPIGRERRMQSVTVATTT